MLNYLQLSTGERQRHWKGILQVGHDDGRKGQHEAAEDLLGIVVDPRISETTFVGIDQNLYPAI